MPGTFINGRQIEDGTVSRIDLNTTVTGNAVIRKILPGSNGIIIDTSTGVDAGTGDVTLKADLTYFNTQYQNRTIAQGQNLVWAGPVSGTGVPTFRALTAGDIPALPYLSTVNLGTSTTNGEITNTAGTNAVLNSLATTGNTDLNLNIGSGLRLLPFGSSTANTPYSGNGISLVVQRNASPTTQQRFEIATGAASSGNVNLVYRTNTDGTWKTFADRQWVIDQGYTTNLGTVTSVAATVAGAALNVTGTPITTAGTLAFTWGGTTGQYVNGAGGLTTFPTIPTVNNGTLTLATSGISTGSASFTANQAGNTTFTVNTPGTDVGGLSAEWGRVTSSTGTNGYIYGIRSFGGGVVNGDAINTTEQGIVVFTATGSSTNMPSGTSASGSIIYNQNFSAGSAQAAFKIFSSTAYDNELYFRRSASSSTWNSWQRFASKEWALAQGWTTNLGTVTSVNVSGSGALGFSGGPITSSGTISTSWSGSTSQYVRGDGTLATFPTIPGTPNLQQVTDVGATTNNAVTINRTVASGIPLEVIRTSGDGDPLQRWSRGNYTDGYLEIASISSANFGAAIKGFNSTSNGPGIYIQGWGKNSFGSGAAIQLRAGNSDYTTGITAGDTLRVQNYTTTQFSIDYNGAVTVNSLAGTGTRAVTVSSTGLLGSTTLTTGTVTSVNVTGSGALTFTGGPIITSGTINAGWSGTTSQYVRGDGSLQTFPTITDTITRLRGTASGTFVSGDITLLAGTNVTITQSGNNITIASTNTTYTGSTSITLSGTSFQRAALTGDVTAAANSNATTIANNVVTYAKMQDIPQGLIGRAAAGTGDPTSITIGTGLAFSGTTLTSTTQDRWTPNSFGYLARNIASGGTANGVSTGDSSGSAGGIQTSGIWVSAATYTVLPTDHNIIFSVSCGVTLPDPSTCLHRILGVKTYGTVTFVGSHIPYDNVTVTPVFTGNTDFRILQAISTPGGIRWMILL